MKVSKSRSPTNTVSKIQISRFLTCFNAKFVSKEFHHPWLLATDKLHTLRNKKIPPLLTILARSQGSCNHPAAGWIVPSSGPHANACIQRPDSLFLRVKTTGTRAHASPVLLLLLLSQRPVRPVASVSNSIELLIIKKIIFFV